MTESRSAFHQQLDGIQRDLIRAAARVTELIGRGTQALLDLDVGAIDAIIESDDETDAITVDVEERCFTLLARQQPMAGDMRAIVTAIRLTAEIERSGDLMVNVGKATRRLQGSAIPPRLRGLLQAMAGEASQLFRVAMDAYAEADDTLAASLNGLDDRLDQIHRDYIQVILEQHADMHDIQAAVQLALVGRYYERIGDHAVNIGHRVQYMVTGTLPEHTGAARHAARSGPAPDAGPDVP